LTHFLVVGAPPPPILCKVGASVASELLLTGNFIYADRALRVGLVSDVVPDTKLDEAARKMALDMLSNSPKGLLMTKEQLKASLDGQTLNAALTAEDALQVTCLNDPECKEYSRRATKRFSKKGKTESKL